MEEQNKPVISVKLKNVNKMYKLFRRSSDRLRAQFSDRVKYTKKYAIHDVSLDIYKGESVALLGKNGAGKSTMLKLITGVSYPTSGFIRVNGRVCALLELTSGFDQELSGRGNIYLKAGILGIKREEIAELEAEIVEFSGLGPYIDQPVVSYSSGMKARLGFAINVNLKPDILIVDEALSVGDNEFRMKCREKIGEMVAQGVTLLFVTHSLEEAKLFCERGIVLQSGHVTCDAPIGEAVEFYERTITKRFVKPIQKQTAGTPGVKKPAAGKPGVKKPAAGKPGVKKPAAGKPGVRKPGAGKPGAGKPGVRRPVPGKSAAKRPGTAAPAGGGKKLEQ